MTDTDDIEVLYARFEDLLIRWLAGVVVLHLGLARCILRRLTTDVELAKVALTHDARRKALALEQRTGAGLPAALRRQGGYWPPGPPSALFRCTCPHRIGGAYANRPAFALQPLTAALPGTCPRNLT
jgi:hypothetical protein